MRTMNQFLFRSAKRGLSPGLVPKLLLAAGLLVLLQGILPGTTLSAQDRTARRSLSKQFQVSRESTLEVQNKYGKIQVVTWEKDSVSLEVDILLTESSTSKLKKLKEDISIGFSQNNGHYIARSKFKSEKGRIASELKSVSHTISGANQHVEINYTVHVPVYLKLVLSNKFGDIYMDDHQGHTDIELSNGVLKANQLKGTTNISLSFARGMVKSMESGTMKLAYSDMTLDVASQLDLESKSSSLNADSVNVLKINSRRDKLHIQRVEYLYGNSNFTQLWIYDFLKESNLYMKYGKLTIEHIIPEFSKIHVESEYTDLSLYFDEKSSYAFDILHHEKTVLRLPVDKIRVSEAVSGKEHLRTTGVKVGEGGRGSEGVRGGEDPSGKVTIDALQKCFIILSTK
ncbi:MAG: hypothetical protein ABFS10_15130 [Bacteroidota bacterium]